MARRLTPGTAFIIGLLALLMVVVVGWFLLASPKRSEAAEFGRDIDSTRTQIKLSQSVIRSEARNARAVDEGRLASAMPPDARESAMIRELETVARAAHVRINSYAPGTPAATGAHQTISIPVVIEGSYFALEAFFRALRARADIAATSPTTVTGSGRLYSVPQIALTGGDDDRFYQVSSTIDAYTFTGAPPTGAPSSSSGTTEPLPASAGASPAAAS